MLGHGSRGSVEEVTHGTEAKDTLMKRRFAALTVSATIATGLLSGLAGTAESAYADASTTVSVPGAQPWTDTGVSVQAGDSVSITADGIIRIAGSDPGKTPDGAPGCIATDSPTDSWEAPGLTCWSMIGQIGSNAAFEVGSNDTFTATSSGELFLGVNDDYFPDNSGAWSASITDTTPGFVALGDSYSSGEGNPPYLDGTHTSGTDTCHRSSVAYPELVASHLGYSSAAFGFHACSGAVIQDFSGQSQEPPQIQWLNSATKLVTLTIGGNNANFAGVITDCIADSTCEVASELAIDQAMANMANNTASNPLSLTQLYIRIAAHAPNAKVLVLGYPRFFPKIPPLLCATGVPGQNFNILQMAWINLKIRQFDNVIQNAVKQAAATGANVGYVDVYNAFDKHELCTASPDMNAAIVSLDPQVVAGSFHPNQSGQTAFATAVESGNP
jgi:hypothetical protein